MRGYKLGYRRREASALQRFCAKVSITPGRCWEWQGSLRRGYGRIKIDGHYVPAHVFSYETFIGTVPKGLRLDHLCRNRACVNPLHVEPVTHIENVRRGDAGKHTALKERAKAHCPKGHPYSPENTYVTPKGWRKCRICRREQQRRSYQKPEVKAGYTRRQRKYRARKREVAV